MVCVILSERRRHLNDTAAIGLGITAVVGLAIVCGCKRESSSTQDNGITNQIAFDGSWTETDENKTLNTTTTYHHNVIFHGDKFRIETRQIRPPSPSRLRFFDGTTLYERLDVPGDVPIARAPKALLLDALRFWIPPPLDGYTMTDQNVVVAGRPAKQYTFQSGAGPSVLSTLCVDEATGIVLRRTELDYDDRGILIGKNTLECDSIKAISVDENTFAKPE
jgi:hypothetical protein